MQKKLSFFGTKLKLSLHTVGWVLSQWRYSLLAFATAVLFFELIYWMFNLSVIITILGSNSVSVVEKINVLMSPIGSIVTSSGSFVALLMIILSLLQGINIAVLVFTIRHQKKVDPSLLGGSTFVGLLALIGLGCPACGTSLITPVVAIFVSTSAIVISEKIMLAVLPIAIIVGLYGIYVLGLRAATAKINYKANTTFIKKI